MIRTALRTRGPRRSSRSAGSQFRHRTSADGISDPAYSNNYIIEGPSTSTGRRNTRTSSSLIKHSFEPIVESLAIGSDYEDSSDLDDSSNCPICGIKFHDTPPHEREAHIDHCLKEAEFSGSPDKQHRANRMIIYRLTEREASGLEECVICFEDFKHGDSVGRLECLCIYHERCILDWFARKGAGECPVHAVHT